jgi:tape measure domain-containing protein
MLFDEIILDISLSSKVSDQIEDIENKLTDLDGSTINLDANLNLNKEDVEYSSVNKDPRTDRKELINLTPLVAGNKELKATIEALQNTSKLGSDSIVSSLKGLLKVDVKSSWIKSLIFQTFQALSIGLFTPLTKGIGKGLGKSVDTGLNKFGGAEFIGEKIIPGLAVASYNQVTKELKDLAKSKGFRNARLAMEGLFELIVQDNQSIKEALKRSKSKINTIIEEKIEEIKKVNLVDLSGINRSELQARSLQGRSKERSKGETLLKDAASESQTKFREVSKVDTQVNVATTARSVTLISEISKSTKEIERLEKSLKEDALSIEEFKEYKKSIVDLGKEVDKNKKELKLLIEQREAIRAKLTTATEAARKFNPVTKENPEIIKDILKTLGADPNKKIDMIAGDADLKMNKMEAGASIGENTIIIKKDLYDKVQNREQLDLNQVSTLIHELQHLVDSNFGDIKAYDSLKSGNLPLDTFIKPEDLPDVFEAMKKHAENSPQSSLEAEYRAESAATLYKKQVSEKYNKPILLEQIEIAKPTLFEDREKQKEALTNFQTRLKDDPQSTKGISLLEKYVSTSERLRQNIISGKGTTDQLEANIRDYDQSVNDVNTIIDKLSQKLKEFDPFDVGSKNVAPKVGSYKSNVSDLTTHIFDVTEDASKALTLVSANKASLSLVSVNKALLDISKATTNEKLELFSNALSDLSKKAERLANKLSSIDVENINKLKSNKSDTDVKALQSLVRANKDILEIKKSSGSPKSDIDAQRKVLIDLQNELRLTRLQIKADRALEKTANTVNLAKSKASTVLSDVSKTSKETSAFLRPSNYGSDYNPKDLVTGLALALEEKAISFVAPGFDTHSVKEAGKNTVNQLEGKALDFLSPGKGKELKELSKVFIPRQIEALKQQFFLIGTALVNSAKQGLILAAKADSLAVDNLPYGRQIKGAIQFGVPTLGAAMIAPHVPGASSLIGAAGSGLGHSMLSGASGFIPDALMNGITINALGVNLVTQGLAPAVEGIGQILGSGGAALGVGGVVSAVGNHQVQKALPEEVQKALAPAEVRKAEDRADRRLKAIEEKLNALSLPQYELVEAKNRTDDRRSSDRRSSGQTIDVISTEVKEKPKTLKLSKPKNENITYSEATRASKQINDEIKALYKAYSNSLKEFKKEGTPEQLDKLLNSAIALNQSISLGKRKILEMTRTLSRNDDVEPEQISKLTGSLGHTTVKTETVNRDLKVLTNKNNKQFLEAYKGSLPETQGNDNAGSEPPNYKHKDLTKKENELLGSFIDIGLSKGLSGKEAEKAALSMVHRLLFIFRQGFKISSPSKVLEQYGRWMDEGLSIGLLSGKSDRALDNLTKDQKEKFRELLDYVKDHKLKVGDLGDLSESGTININDTLIQSALATNVDLRKQPEHLGDYTKVSVGAVSRLYGSSLPEPIAANVNDPVVKNALFSGIRPREDGYELPKTVGKSSETGIINHNDALIKSIQALGIELKRNTESNLTDTLKEKGLSIKQANNISGATLPEGIAVNVNDPVVKNALFSGIRPREDDVVDRQQTVKEAAKKSNVSLPTTGIIDNNDGLIRSIRGLSVETRKAENYADKLNKSTLSVKGALSLAGKSINDFTSSNETNDTYIRSLATEYGVKTRELYRVGNRIHKKLLDEDLVTISALLEGSDGVDKEAVKRLVDSARLVEDSVNGQTEEIIKHFLETESQLNKIGHYTDRSLEETITAKTKKLNNELNKVAKREQVKDFTEFKPVTEDERQEVIKTKTIKEARQYNEVLESKEADTQELSKGLVGFQKFFYETKDKPVEKGLDKTPIFDLLKDFALLAIQVGAAHRVFTAISSLMQASFRPALDKYSQNLKEGVTPGAYVGMREDLLKEANDKGQSFNAFYDRRLRTTAALEPFKGSVDTNKVAQDLDTLIQGTGSYGETANRIQVALVQGLSKGTVSSEELFQQLGDAVAGVAQVSADIRNQSVAELRKDIARGGVDASTFYPELLSKLADQYRPLAESNSKSFLGTQRIVKNNETEFLAALGTPLIKPTHELLKLYNVILDIGKYLGQGLIKAGSISLLAAIGAGIGFLWKYRKTFSEWNTSLVNAAIKLGVSKNVIDKVSQPFATGAKAIADNGLKVASGIAMATLAFDAFSSLFALFTGSELLKGVRNLKEELKDLAKTDETNRGLSEESSKGNKYKLDAARESRNQSFVQDILSGNFVRGFSDFTARSDKARSDYTGSKRAFMSFDEYDNNMIAKEVGKLSTSKEFNDIYSTALTLNKKSREEILSSTETKDLELAKQQISTVQAKTKEFTPELLEQRPELKAFKDQVDALVASLMASNKELGLNTDLVAKNRISIEKARVEGSQESLDLFKETSGNYKAGQVEKAQETSLLKVYESQKKITDELIRFTSTPSFQNKENEDASETDRQYAEGVRSELLQETQKLIDAEKSLLENRINGVKAIDQAKVTEREFNLNLSRDKNNLGIDNEIFDALDKYQPEERSRVEPIGAAISSLKKSDKELETFLEKRSLLKFQKDSNLISSGDFNRQSQTLDLEESRAILTSKEAERSYQDAYRAFLTDSKQKTKELINVEDELSTVRSRNISELATLQGEYDKVRLENMMKMETSLSERLKNTLQTFISSVKQLKESKFDISTKSFELFKKAELTVKYKKPTKTEREKVSDFIANGLRDSNPYEPYSDKFDQFERSIKRKSKELVKGLSGNDLDKLKKEYEDIFKGIQQDQKQTLLSRSLLGSNDLDVAERIKAVYKSQVDSIRGQITLKEKLLSLQLQELHNQTKINMLGIDSKAMQLEYDREIAILKGDNREVEVIDLRMAALKEEKQGLVDQYNLKVDTAKLQTEGELQGLKLQGNTLGNEFLENAASNDQISLDQFKDLLKDIPILSIPEIKPVNQPLVGGFNPSKSIEFMQQNTVNLYQQPGVKEDPRDVIDAFSNLLRKGAEAISLE